MDVATPHQEAFIEDLGFPEPLLWFVEGMLANATPTLNLARWAKLFLQGSLRLVGATERIGRERSRLLGGGRTRGFLPYLGMCEDAADGRLVLDRSGRLDLRWNAAASARNLTGLERAMRELSDALGGEFVPSPLWSGLGQQEHEAAVRDARAWNPAPVCRGGGDRPAHGGAVPRQRGAPRQDRRRPAVRARRRSRLRDGRLLRRGLGLFRLAWRRDARPVRRSLVAAAIVTLLSVVVLPLAASTLLDRREDVALPGPLPSRLDVAIITAGAAGRDAPATAPRPAPALWDVRYSVGRADAAGVRWQLLDTASAQEALPAWERLGDRIDRRLLGRPGPRRETSPDGR